MEVVLDALKDTALVFPFILIIYILIELLERGTNLTRSRRTLQGPLAPLLGAATGIVPQCGFSVMAAKLYENGLIRTGTVIAVFLATSDEALVILLANSPTNLQAAKAILPLIIVKMLVAVAAGYLINLILRDKAAEVRPLPAHSVLCAGTNAHISDDRDGYGHGHEEGDCHEDEEEHCYSCGREHEGKSKFRVYFVDPLLHSLKITAYILIVNLVFGFIIDAVGEDRIASGIVGGIYVQPLITAAIGLIPNCASSTIITGAFVSGGIITFGSCVAGLCTNAGLGLVVLLRNPSKIKRNLLIIVTLYVIAIAVGIVINAISAATGWMM